MKYIIFTIMFFISFILIIKSIYSIRHKKYNLMIYPKLYKNYTGKEAFRIALLYLIIGILLLIIFLVIFILDLNKIIQIK